MKKLLLIALLLVATISFAQKKEFTPQYYNGGVEWFGYWATVDTGVTYTSEYFDMSPIDGQTLYFTYNYNTGNTNDTLTMTIQGMWGDGSMTSNLDTFYVTSVSGTQIIQLTPTLIYTAPLMRVSFVSYYGGALDQRNTPLKPLRISFYAKANDAIYKWNKNWYN